MVSNATIMKYPLVLTLTGLLAAGSTLAAGVDLSKLPPPADKQGVTYEKDIHALFKASCVRCHSGERPKAALRLDTLANVLKGSKDGKVIVPGDSAKSKLVIAISRLNPKSAMPPEHKEGRGRRWNGPRNNGRGGEQNGAANQPERGPRREMGPPPKPLTSEQVGLVRAWIDQGAK